MEKRINCFDKIFVVSRFSTFESILAFYNNFNLIETIKEFNNYLFNLNESDFYDYLEIISLSCNHLDLLIASLAPYSYKNIAYLLQNKLNILRRYLEIIPQSKNKFKQYLIFLKEEKIEEDNDIIKIIERFENRDADKKENKKEDPIGEKVELISETKLEEKIEERENEIFNEGTKKEQILEQENSNKLKIEDIKKRIETRNKLIQTLLDIYHEKKNGYRLMLNLFRGLDIYRRMSLSDENFDKNLFMKNFIKYLTFFKEANLIQLCLERNKELDEPTVKKMIVDCLKIINKQIDKSRFKILFSDKLNYRSGFNEEFQQKVRWLYFPERRRPKRNIDELYSIKSVTKSTDHLKKIKNFKSYISLLSKRDIDIANKLLPILHKIYYKNSNIKKFLINVFYSIDKYEYSIHELTEEQKKKFKEEIKMILFNKPVDQDKPPLLNIMIDLNPKINPNDIKNLLPICINIMKEKIDIGFERIKKEFPDLANSFNPLTKYYQIYDKRLFLIYKRV
ncbi:MAG TPA: hypothetical protein PLE45_10715 [Spirochaetota bacterium]|nr:hypothetical protein [Spirochaetota bacterium]HOL57557.1 hypothetical protein [Spirochaetota bacterium]HPP05110.1 hypothetical protein [Spirochaetota bacterium]